MTSLKQKFHLKLVMSFGEWTPTASSTSIVAPVQSIINIQSITKVNFQEVINAKIKAEMH